MDEKQPCLIIYSGRYKFSKERQPKGSNTTQNDVSLRPLKTIPVHSGYKMRNNLLIRSLVIFLVAFSCIPNKNLIYLQKKDGNATPVSETEEYTSQYNLYKVQTGDVLNIKVLSQDPASVAAFNVDGGTGNTQMQMSTTQLYVTGFSVDELGNIEMPLLGKLPVKGKTIQQVTDLLSKAIDKYASNAVVKVKLVSFKITVLGEVRTPGVHYIYNDRANLLEAIGYAGDLADYANRHSVKLIRTIDQKTYVTNLDLTDRKLIESNSFYLLPNDVIYVEPMKAKNFRLNLPAISLMVSSITTILVIINLVLK